MLASVERQVYVTPKKRKLDTSVIYLSEWILFIYDDSDSVTSLAIIPTGESVALDSPMISGMLMQLSKARPVMNLQTEKDQKLFVLAVAMEATRATLLHSIRAGILPL